MKSCPAKKTKIAGLGKVRLFLRKTSKNLLIFIHFSLDISPLDFIKREIELIDPDIIVWLGANTFDMDIHTKYLGAVKKKEKVFMVLHGEQVPIIRMWHTSATRINYRKSDKFDNKIIAKLAAKLADEMKKYYISSENL